MFSFNNPFGACEKCSGLGTFMKVDPDLIVPNRNLSIRQGAIKASGWYYSEGSIAEMYYEGLARHYGFSLDTPYKALPARVQQILLYGSDGEKIRMRREIGSIRGTYETDFEGVINNLERRFRESNSEWMKEEIAGWMSSVPCPECGGKRLKKSSLAVTVGGLDISSFTEMSVDAALEFIAQAQLSERDLLVAESIFKEIRERMGFLKSVGLGYLTLARATGTLSGGEAQRIRLATQIGSSLMGCSTSSTSPALGFISGITTGLSRPLSACGIWVIPSLWWSTTRILSGPPTILWISAPVPVFTVARWFVPVA